MILIIFLSYSVSYYGSDTLRGHDSYLHLATAYQIISNGHLTVTSTVYTNFPGFFLLINILTIFNGGLSGPTLEKLISPFLSTFLILMYYPAFKSWTRSNEWTLFAILALFVSDIGFLAGYAPSPSLLANILFPIVLYTITKADRKYAVLTFLVIFFISIVHPSTALLIPFLFLFLYLFKRSTIILKKDWVPKFLSRTSITIILFSAIIAFAWSTFYSNLFLTSMSQGLDSFLSHALSSGFGFVYSPILPSSKQPLIYTILRALSSYALLILVPLGFLSLMKTRKKLAFLNGSWLFLAVSVFLLGSIALGGFFLWSQLGIRIENFALFPLALLSGYGILFFFRNKAFPKVSFLKPIIKIKRLRRLIYIFTLIMILITPMTLFWYEFNDRLLPEDVQAFSFLANFKTDNSAVLGFAPILDYYSAYKLGTPVLGTDFYTSNLTQFEMLVVNNNVSFVVFEKYLPVRFSSSTAEGTSQQIYEALSGDSLMQNATKIYDNGVCQILSVTHGPRVEFAP